MTAFAGNEITKSGILRTGFKPCASGSYSMGAADMCQSCEELLSWSVFIDGTDTSSVMNLGEVQAFDSSGSLITPAGAEMFSTYNSANAAGMCIDGNPSSNCHSLTPGPNEYLRVDYAAPLSSLSSIVVTNRDQDCCRARIVGAKVHVTSGNPTSNAAARGASLWSTTVESSLASYAFSPTGTARGYALFEASSTCSRCSTCDVGKYVSSACTSTADTGCSTCAAGTSGDGSASCEPCTKGKYSSAGAAYCITAEAGYKANSANTAAVECSVNEYSTGATGACSICEGSEFSSAGSSKCDSCGPGTYMSGSTKTCQTLTIGAGPAPDPFTVTAGYVCPSRVDENNWLPNDDGFLETYGDTFSVSQTGTQVLVQRTDTGDLSAGWGMSLAFLCCTNPCKDCDAGK
jgi:hypothetical protein